MTEDWEGFQNRECGDHRTTGFRAWCSDCSEWCYPEIPCKGCELPNLRSELEASHQREAELREALTSIAVKRQDGDDWEHPDFDWKLISTKQEAIARAALSPSDPEGEA